MDQVVEECEHLNELKQKISNEEVGGIIEKSSKNIIVNIASVIKEGKFSANEIDIVFFDLLGDEGLPGFLEETLKVQKSFEDCKRDGCELIQLIFTKYAAAAKKFALSVKELIWKIYRLDDSAKIRVSALAAFCQILESLSSSGEDVAIIEKMNLVSVSKELTNDLRRKSRMPATVKLQVMKLIGLISRYFSPAITEPIRLLRLFLDEVSREYSYSKGPDMTVIAGSLYGIHGVLSAFSETIAEKQDIQIQIFEVVDEMVLKGIDLPRREAPRAALGLFAECGDIFEAHVCRKYEKWFKALLLWTRHDNADDHRCGYEAIEKLTFLAARHIENLSRDKERNMVLVMFKFFLDNFKNLLTGYTSYKDRRLAITGIGLFSGPVRTFLKPGETLTLFNMLIKHLEVVYFSGSELSYEDRAVLPIAVKSLGLITFNVEEVQDNHIDSLKKFSVAMMDNYTKLFDKKIWCGKAVLITMYALSNKTDMLNDYTHSIIYQSLLRSLNHPLPAEVMILKESGIDEYIPTYKDYLQFWRNLTTSLQSTDKEILKYDAESRQSVHQVICSSLMKCAIDLITKLDLSLEEANKEDADKEAGKILPCYLEARKPSDQVLFSNLVDLLLDLLKNRSDINWFSDWILPLGRITIAVSEKAPQVSGFYRLFALILDFADKQGTYQDTTSKTVVLFVNYICTVAEKLADFRDEVLTSALQAVLSIPSSWLSSIVEKMTSILKICFSQGLSYLFLAEKALDALNRWSLVMEHNEFSDLMGKICIWMEPYLRSQPPVLKQEESDAIGFRVAHGVRRVNLKSNSRYSGMGDTTSRQWETIQLRILMLLTDYGSKVTSHLYDRPLEEISEKAVAWDQEEHLKFRVPFPDIKVTIYLDSLLPRVVELATSNSDRRVKLAACEVLHALFIFMIGIGSERTEEYGRHHRLEKLYERTFPIVITLASDLDDVVRKIFQALLGQTVRWFSKPISTENGLRLTNEADKILSCILDKLEDVNPILRNVAAEALCEFCVWNVKQTKPKELSKPDIIKRILKSLYSLALHPSQTKRMGACTGWNAIYQEFREHPLLVEMFTFELLWHFVECLAKCDQDPKCSPTVLQAISAVRHLKRIVIEKSNLFLKPKRVVRAPPNFPPDPSLKDIMFWLFQHIARPEKEARHLTIELFFDFLPKISDSIGAAQFIKNEMAEGKLSRLIFILESDLNLKNMNNIVFMRALEASLEAYTSIFEAGGINPDEILTNSESSLLEKVNFFVKKINCSFRVEIDKREEIFMTCSVVVQLLKFITALLQSNSSTTLGTILANDAIFHLVKMLMFSPDTLGFHLLELTSYKSLKQVQSALLTSSNENMPLNFFERFCSILEDGIDVPSEVNKVLSDETCSAQTIAGVSLVLETLDSKIRKGWKFYMDPMEILYLVIKSIKEKHKLAKNVLWSSQQHKTFSSVVRLCTIMDLEVESAAKLLGDEASNFWYDISTVIIPFLALGFSKKKECFERLVDLIGQCQNVVVESLMINYINVVCGKPKVDSDQVNFMMKHLSEKWSKLCSWASMDSEKSLFLVNCLKKLPFNSNQFEWLTGLLGKRELNIEVKLETLSVIKQKNNLFEHEEKKLAQSLNYLSALHFPLKTYDIKEDGSKAGFLRIFDQVLNAAITLSSSSMMGFLIQTVSGECSHLRFGATKITINEMVQRASFASQGCLIATFFDLVLHQNLNSETIRNVYELGEGVLIHSNICQFKNGIVSVIPEIVSKLEEVNKGYKEQLALKIICFQILAVMFTRLDKEIINADVNEAFCKSNNLDGLDSKAFLKKVVGFSDGIRSENLSVPNDCTEDYRKYHCAAYNCLIAIVTCTQTVEKFYVGYLYKEPKHIQATTFLEYLIVDDDIYFDEKNVGDISTIKKYFVNLRLNSNHDEVPSQNLRYLPSQTLVQSSLSEDFSRFDFSTSSLKERAHKFTKDRNSVELVKDPMNEHECMAQLVGVMLRMNDLELFKTPELPQSLKEIKDKLINARVPLIVQVFLGKLICNTSHIIETYSGEFLGPLLCVITRILGEKKHFPPVARDLLALTLSWAARTVPDPDSILERSHVNRIIESLVQESVRSSSKSQKLLLEILRTVVEKWQPCAEFPMATLLSLFKGSEDDKLWALCALDALLINSVKPINSISRSNRTELNDKVLECWRIKRRDTLVASGEVCGELHRLITEKQDKDGADLAFLDSLKKLLTVVRREDKTEFINLLYRMQIHSPTVLNEYMSQISSTIGSQYGDAKVWCVECLITGMETMTDPWEDIGGQEIIALISVREPAIQEASLRLIQKMLGKLSHSRIKELVKVVLNVDNFTVRSCRREAYNFLIMALEINLNSTEANEVDEYEPTRLQIKNVLLKGLLDSDDNIRNQLYNFWSKSPQLPKSTVFRALDVFDKCYSPTQESSFLIYSLKLLLDRTKDSPDYSSLIFENPLSECTFKDLPLSSGRLTMLPGTLMPMFAQTMRLHAGQTVSTLKSLVSSMSLDSYGRGNAVLASQTQRQHQFEPTQVQGDGFSVTLPMDMDVTTLGTFILPERGSRRIFTKPDEEKVIPPQMWTYRNLNVSNRRNLSTTIESKREERRKVETEARKKKRFDRISIYRRYRIGELPDVQISYAALLTPLLALSQLDADLSRDIFVLLLKSIRQEDIPGFDSRASNIFLRAIKSSTEFNPHFIATLLEVTIAADGNISIPSREVVDASIAARTEMLGSSVIEKYLSKKSKSSVEPAKKKSRLHFVEEEHDTLWIRMAELSRHLGDVDTSNAILLEKLDFGEDAKEGLKAFNIGDFKKAADKLVAVSKQDHERENYWIEYYHEALRSMGDWDQLEQSLPNKTDISVWKHPSTLQEIFDCNVRLVLSRRGFSTEFNNFVNEIVKDRNKAEMLKRSVPGELAFLYALEGNRSVSQLHFEASVKNFIFDWESTPVILPEARKAVVEKFIPSTDIYRFMERETFGLNRLQKIWAGDKASETDDILTRDKVFTRRYYLLTELKSIEDTSKEALSSRLEATFDFVNFALSRRNKYLAYKALEKSSEYHEDPSYDVSLKAMYDLAYTRATLFRAVSEEPQRRVKWIIKGQEILDDLSLSQLPSAISVDIHAEKANICSTLAQSLVVLLDSSMSLPSSYAEKLKEIFNVEYTWNKERIYSGLIKMGREQLMESVELVDRERKPKLILQFVKYCSDAIESSLLQEGVKREMLKDKVTGILTAMQHGLLDARKMFPSLLPLLEVNDWLGEEFMIKISDIPSWMFLSWDKQLFAWLPSKIQPWITPLVIRLCKDYPAVLAYGYNVSKESWNKTINHETRKEIEHLLRSSALQEKFLDALQHAALPSVLAETFLTSAIRTKDFEKAYNLLNNTIFSDNCETRGSLYRDFTRKWKAKFIQAFEDEKHTMSSVTQLLLDMKKESKMPIQKVLLKDLSSWLSEYRRLGLSESIELPGQYGSGVKPMPEYHIYVESFEHEALILGSLRRPVKIGIVGSNAKSYKYLVKFGEDLRQDERIESLFEAANSTLFSNPETRKRGMRIKTYKVFPLSPRHGLIEWMEGVVTMQDFLDLSNEEKAKVESACRKYSRLYKGPRDYIPGYSSSAQEDVESNYDEALRICIPKNTMKQRFERLSSSPIGLYRVRMSFIRSHATMSIVHWILGIGDRHTSNNMVSVLTGESVGIDFGYAFDVSVEFLSVPEVVPIRLTPQITEVTEPIGIQGTMKSSMVHTLNAIKEDNDVFLAVLDVFVKEPSIDWIELAKNAGDEKFLANAEQSWFPLKKIEIARNKLMNGLNPAYATLEALKNKSNYEAIKNHVLGTDSQRGRLKQHGLSTEEQVTCLLEQSTDKNLLGRMYVGWHPFL